MKKNIGVLLLPLLLWSCSALPTVISSSGYHRKDLKVTINDKVFVGTASIRTAEKYKINVKSQGNLDYLILKTCHRQDGDYRGWNVKKWFFDVKNEANILYVPNEIEKRFCGIHIMALAKKGAESQEFFGVPDDSLASYGATSYCNGEVVKYKGNAICDARSGLVQAIRFADDVKVSASSNECAAAFQDIKATAKYFEYTAILGECLYVFSTQKNEILRLTVFGWENDL